MDQIYAGVAHHAIGETMAGHHFVGINRGEERMGGSMMLVATMLAAMLMVRLHPDLPISRWLAGVTVDPLARRLNRTTPAQ